MDLDEIRPHHSVGDLVLGWSESQVIKTLGDNYSREIDEWGDLSIEYESIGMSFTFFESEEFRLGRISVERSTASLCGERLIGRSKEEIKKFIAKILRSTVSEEDGVEHENGLIQEWIDVDSHSLMYWFHDDALYLIDISCEWLDDEVPNWPGE